MSYFCVYLNKQRVKGPIGWYESERKKGVELIISVTAELKKPGGKDELADSVDYTSLVEIVNAEAAKETRLLETLAAAIIEKIFVLKPNLVRSVIVKIDKPNIPHPGFNADSCGIELRKENPNLI
jgi:dihydroneopterin aldolase